MDFRVMPADKSQPSGGLRAGDFQEGTGYEVQRRAGSGDYLLIYTVSGSGFHRSGRATRLVATGHALLYAPGVPQHYGTSRKKGRWELLWTHFQPDGGLLHLLNWPLDPAGVGFLELGKAAQNVDFCLRELVEWHQRRSANHGQFARNALERALLWCDSVNPSRPGSDFDPRIMRAVNLITSRMYEQLNVQTVADEVGLSRSRFSHLFKSQTGRSFPEYLEALRLDRAEDLLRMTNRTISEVARDSGFADPLYFSRRFRLRKGVSPKQWRTNLSASE